MNVWIENMVKIDKIQYKILLIYRFMIKKTHCSDAIQSITPSRVCTPRLDLLSCIHCEELI